MDDALIRRMAIEINTRVEEADYWMAAFDESSPEHVKAAYLYGGFYEHGTHKPKDATLMVKYYARAANRGHAGACFCLARAYLNGTLIPQNLELAMHYASIPVDYDSTIYDTCYYEQSCEWILLESIREVIKKSLNE